MFLQCCLIFLILLPLTCGGAPPNTACRESEKTPSSQEKNSLAENSVNQKKECDRLNLMAYKLKDYDYKMSAENAEKALVLAEKSEYFPGVVAALNIQASLFLQKGEPDKAKEMLDTAWEVANRVGKNEKSSERYIVGEAEILLGYYRYYRLVGRYDTAFSRLLDVQVRLENESARSMNGYRRTQAMLYRSFGEIAFLDNFQEQEQAVILDYFQKNLELQQKLGDTDAAAVAYCSLGDACQRFKRFKESEEYFREAQALNSALKNPYIKALIKKGTGKQIRDKDKNYKKAKDLFLETRGILERIGNVLDRVSVDNEIGGCLLELAKDDKKEHDGKERLSDKPDETEEFLMSVFKDSMALNDAANMVIASNNLKSLFKNRGNIAKYERISNDSKAVTDLVASFSASGVFRKIVEMEKQKERQKQKYIITVLTFGALFLILAVFLMIYRKGRLENQLREEQKNSLLKDEWMYTLAHEYKTPLTSIKLAYDNLSRYFSKMTEDEIRERLRHIGGNAEILDDLLRKIMELSRVFQPSIQDLVKICHERTRQVSETIGNSHNIIF